MNNTEIKKEICDLMPSELSYLLPLVADCIINSIRLNCKRIVIRNELKKVYGSIHNLIFIDGYDEEFKSFNEHHGEVWASYKDNHKNRGTVNYIRNNGKNFKLEFEEMSKAVTQVFNKYQLTVDQKFKPYTDKYIKEILELD